MKKMYIKPEVVFENTEIENDILAGSGSLVGNGNYQIDGGSGGDNLNGDIVVDYGDDESDAKRGSFAYWEDDTDNWAF